MTTKYIQSAVLEWTCDECGKDIRGESPPADFSSIQIESYGVYGGRAAFRLDLCSECILLPKYVWTHPAS